MTWSNLIIDKSLKDRGEFQVGHRQERQAKKGNSEIGENVQLEEGHFYDGKTHATSAPPK